ncbi:MAG: peptidylprolyl isomerase [Ornithinimicrobium sp.]|uniref:peptidylprolyl isomerase n=1 Tax=Ornithinimicrobium sp. TaxID=1977084 RepID=UPI0026E0BFF9|nr:peptidylprolyl isomerase [Ornithinimicrobium sp.]MDO5740972.1 peptidylprolyl isomerase [Ornithinimicrobium sp.]
MDRRLIAVTTAALLSLTACGEGTPAPEEVAAAGSLECAPPPALPSGVTTYSQQDLPDPVSVEPATVRATIATNCGDLVLELDAAQAPQTVASFLFLGEEGYWDDSPCHRLTTAGIFVLQCGDPTGDGRGSPGYGYGIENAPVDGHFPPGTLAMARTNDPFSNGGQFFIVYEDTQLPTDGGGYSIFGKVTSGMEIVEGIAAAGVDGGRQDGSPAQPISILSVTVKE